MREPEISVTAEPSRNECFICRKRDTVDGRAINRVRVARQTFSPGRYELTGLVNLELCNTHLIQLGVQLIQVSTGS